MQRTRLFAFYQALYHSLLKGSAALILIQQNKNAEAAGIMKENTGLLHKTPLDYSRAEAHAALADNQQLPIYIYVAARRWTIKTIGPNFFSFVL